MTVDPDPRTRPAPDGDPHNGERHNSDIERDTGRGERVPRREGDTERTVRPEDEDRRVRPGETRPFGTMP